MTPDELRPILTAYRKQIERGWSKATAHPSYEGADGSPVGQCGVTSAWLQKRLREDHGLYIRYCRGRYYDSPKSLGVKHCWLEHINKTRSIVVDLTADQFDAEAVVCDTYRGLYDKGLHYVTHDAMAEPDAPVIDRLALLEAALS